MAQPVLPHSSYVTILAQSVCKLAQETFRNLKGAFLVHSAISKPKIDVFGTRPSWLVYKFVKLAQHKNPWREYWAQQVTGFKSLIPSSLWTLSMFKPGPYDWCYTKHAK